MSDTGKTIALIKALAPAPEIDPEQVKQDVEDWLDDHPEATTTVQDGTITRAKLDSGLEGDIADLEEAKDLLDGLQIECYDRVETGGSVRQDIELSFTLEKYPKATTGTIELQTDIADSKYATATVTPGETIHIHARNNWMVRAYMFADADNKGISYYPTASATPALFDGDVVVPDNAVTVYVMGKKNDDVYAYRMIDTPVEVEYQLDIEELRSKLAAGGTVSATIANDGLTVTNGTNGMTAGFHTSDNNTLSFGYIYGKVANDDVCPLRIDNNYVGGNHGFPAGVKVTDTEGHGKTTDDIGSVYKRTGTQFEYVIVRIDSATQMTLIRRDGTCDFINTSLTITFDHISGGTHTDTIAPTSFTVYNQLKPAVNNAELTVYVDGEVFTSGTATCGKVTIVETYNVIDLASVAEYLIENVGNNTNASYYNDAIDGLAKRTTVYEIMPDMSIVTSDYLYALKTFNLSWMGIVQSQMAGTTFYVPYTTYAGKQTITETVNFDTATWADENRPPHKFYQPDTSGNMKGTLMLYPYFGLTKNRADALGDDGRAGTIDGSTNKFYPYLCYHSGDQNNGAVLGGYAIRAPFEFESDGTFAFVYKFAGETYAEIECVSAGTFDVDLGTDCTVVSEVMNAQNMVLETMTIVNGKATVKCSGNGSMTVKLG